MKNQLSSSMTGTLVSAGFALAVTLGLGTAAHATDTPPGTTNAPAMTVNFGGQQLTTLSDTVTANTFTASYTTSVYSDPNNIYGAGLLDFVYQFTDNSGQGIEHLTASDFSGYSTNVGYSSSTAGVAPITVSRTSDGQVVNFGFEGASAVTAGNTSRYLVIQTNATGYTSGSASLQDGSAVTVKAFKPISAAPEPGVWLLMMGGVAFMGAALRMSKRRIGSVVSAA